MTSVPSRQRLLSGNSWFISIFTAFILFGCASSSTSSARTDILKPDVKEVEETAPVLVADTIEWTFRSEEEFPPVTVDTKVAAYRIDKVTREFYKIALLLPMRIKQTVPSINTNNKKFADFYAGIQLAAQKERDLITMDIPNIYIMVQEIQK